MVCHASAWDLDNLDDIRIKMCTKVNAEDFYTVHHELGHNYYQRAYKDQPFLFQNGANDGFHEAIGDFVGLSALTPTYLNQIGLLQTRAGRGGGHPVPAEDGARQDRLPAVRPDGRPLALERVPRRDRRPAEYNDAWWPICCRSTRASSPPGPRPADAFDPGAKYHIPGNTPYTRYFLAHIYQFQFHRAACEQAGWTGPAAPLLGLRQQGGRREVQRHDGDGPVAALARGDGGLHRRDATSTPRAVADYFAPLNTWLTRAEPRQGLRLGGLIAALADSAVAGKKSPR